MHKLNNRERLEALINYYSEGNKSMFGRLIGLQPSSITNWIRRDTLDFELIYSKCADLNPHWLLTGEGEMLKSTVRQSSPQQEAAPDQFTGLIQELMSELRQKNEEIGELRERIGRADSTIESLQRELNRHAKSAGDVTFDESARAV